jgi:hypothetical protein
VFALAGALGLAAGLRAWPLLAGEMVWHPDEICMVVYPLNMLSGDLNPHVFTCPGFHFFPPGTDLFTSVPGEPDPGWSEPADLGGGSLPV